MNELLGNIIVLELVNLICDWPFADVYRHIIQMDRHINVTTVFDLFIKCSFPYYSVLFFGSAKIIAGPE